MTECLIVLDIFGNKVRGEEKKREDQRGERVRRKKRHVREKVEKSRFTVFCQ